jgi:hypothetical protein
MGYNLRETKRVKKIMNTNRNEESQRVRESSRRRENGAVGDHVGDCVFLGAEAHVQARFEDSAQGR